MRRSGTPKSCGVPPLLDELTCPNRAIAACVQWNKQRAGNRHGIMQYTLYKCYLGESRLRYTLHQQCGTPAESKPRPETGAPRLSDGTDSAREVGHRTHDMHKISLFLFFVPRCMLPSFGLLLAFLVCIFFLFKTRRNFVHRTCVVQTSHGL